MISKDSVTKIKKVVERYKKEADYLDVKLIQTSGTLISYRKRKVEDVSLPRGYNGLVRAITKGGWGYVNFSDIRELGMAVKRAISYSKKVGKGKTVLAPTEKVVENIPAAKSEKSFSSIPLNKKIEIIKGYNELVWKLDNKLSSSSLYYTDSLQSKLLVTSEGTVLNQEKAYVYSILSLVKRKDGVIQRYSTHLADNNYSDLKNKENVIKDTVKTVNEIVNAPVVKSGNYTVILEPRLAGVFAHEAFGHLSEADNVYENEQLAKVMTLGKRFGSKLITIIDDPTKKGYRGSYRYDDEGVRSKKTILLYRGILRARLHKRETAGKLNEQNNGHGRSSGAVRPLVRMGITYIQQGKSTFNQMLRGVENGIYCVSWQGGNTDHENFTFTAGYGIEIKNGKLGRIVRDVKLTGNLFETLQNVDMVGNDLSFEGGTCGKAGQYLPETSGAPHIRIQNVMVLGG